MNTSKKQVERDDHGRLVKGSTANMNGRPKKGYSITEAFRSMFEEKPEEKEKIVKAIKQRAVAGDSTAIKLLWNYMDGMPKQAVELTGEDGGPVEQSIKITFE